MDSILEEAVRQGLAKTKQEALRMGILMLDRQYNLLEKLEDEADLSDARKISKLVEAGKMRTIPWETVKKKLLK
ncbi:MAG: hypothetical protein AABY04_01320 [Candidatus Micrarchaeota archaeon]